MQYHDNPLLDQLIGTIESQFSAGQLEAVAASVLQLHDMATIAEDQTALAAAANYSGMLEFSNGNLDRSVVLRKKALSIGLAHDSPHFPYFNMKAYNGLAGVYAEKGDYYASLGNYLNAYHIASAHPEYQFESLLLNNIGNLFVWLDECEMALGYLTNAYDCYVESDLHDRGLLVSIIRNTVEAYSYVGEFQAAEEWATTKPVQWERKEKVTLECMLLANKAQQYYEQGDIEEAIGALEQFLSRAEATDEFLYMFRSYLNMGRMSIELGDQELATRVMERLVALDKRAVIQTFRFSFAELRILYYRQFIKDPAAHSLPDDYYDFYYWHSQRMVDQLKGNYLSSLLLELEVDKSKFANNSVLRKSFHLEKDLELDPLTNLLNRASAEKYVTQYLATRSQDVRQAMLLVSINDFKHLNDLYGHHYGDMILLEVADIINDGLSSDTVVSRFSGGEFLIFMSHARSVEHVNDKAKQIAERGSQISLPDSKLEKISFCIGVTIIDQPMSFEEALATATGSMQNM